MEAPKQKDKPHLAIFTSSLMGHFIPLLQLSKRLSECHGFPITFITPKCYDRHTVYTQSLAPSGLEVRFVELPEPEIGQEEEERLILQTPLFRSLEKCKGLVEDVLKSLSDSSSPPCAFIIDIFCVSMLDVGAKLHIPTYVYVPFCASAVCLMLYHPTLHSEMKVSFKEIEGPVEIPGLPSIPARDLPAPIQDRSDPIYHDFLHFSSFVTKASGILINTFEDLERESIKALVDGKVLPRNAMPSVYTVGPPISSPWLESEKVSTEKAECLKWLDQQPYSSVIFVSFGSEGTLSAPQIVELALGLEGSGQQFLWVLRAAQSTNLAGPDISELLPPGFESRTKDRGLVVASWAPQIPILSHPSTGGFLSHCGWNSTLESISFGVPIIAWPLFAEQRLNRFFLVNEIKMAIEAEAGADGIVRKEEVERVARELMEGEEGIKVRTKAKELKESAKRALAEGGSSYNSLAAAAALWKKRQFIHTL